MALLNKKLYGTFQLDENCINKYKEIRKAKGLEPLPFNFKYDLKNVDSYLRIDRDLIQAFRSVGSNTPNSHISYEEPKKEWGKWWKVTKNIENGIEFIYYDTLAYSEHLEIQKKNEMYTIQMQNAYLLALLKKNQQWVQELVIENEELRNRINEIE